MNPIEIELRIFSRMELAAKAIHRAMDMCDDTDVRLKLMLVDAEQHLLEAMLLQTHPPEKIVNWEVEGE